jgi:hypothetical protein
MFCGPLVPFGAAAPQRGIATSLLLAPLFLQRVFIGGEGDSYADYPGFSLVLVGYACHFALIGLALIRLARRPALPAGVTLLLGVLLLISLVQILFAFTLLRDPYAGMFLPMGRGWLWLLAVASYALMFSAEEFIRVFTWMSRAACVLGLVCLLQYEVTGVAFGVHIARGYPRVQGFFSEPSALASILPGFLLLSVYRRRAFDALLALGAVLASASVIVYTTTALVLIIYFAMLLEMRRTSVLILASLIVLAILVPFAMDQGIADKVSLVAGSLLQRTGDPNEADIFAAIAGRTLIALSALGDVVALYSIDNMGGGLARFIGQLMALDEMRSAGVQYVGYGLNVYGTLSVERHGDVLDFGFTSYLLTSFGIPAGLLAVAWIVRCSSRALVRGGALGVVLVSGVVATLGNSAGGLHAYALPLLLMIGYVIPGFRRDVEFAAMPVSHALLVPPAAGLCEKR